MTEMSQPGALRTEVIEPIRHGRKNGSGLPGGSWKQWVTVGNRKMVTVGVACMRTRQDGGGRAEQVCWGGQSQGVHGPRWATLIAWYRNQTGIPLAFEHGMDKRCLWGRLFRARAQGRRNLGERGGG